MTQVLSLLRKASKYKYNQAIPSRKHSPLSCSKSTSFCRQSLAVRQSKRFALSNPPVHQISSSNWKKCQTWFWSAKIQSQTCIEARCLAWKIIGGSSDTSQKAAFNLEQRVVSQTTTWAMLKEPLKIGRLNYSASSYHWRVWWRL